MFKNPSNTGVRTCIDLKPRVALLNVHFTGCWIVSKTTDVGEFFRIGCDRTLKTTLVESVEAADLCEETTRCEPVVWNFYVCLNNAVFERKILLSIAEPEKASNLEHGHRRSIPLRDQRSRYGTSFKGVRAEVFILFSIADEPCHVEGWVSLRRVEYDLD